jgi:hypothetical protein
MNQNLSIRQLGLFLAHADRLVLALVIAVLAAGGYGYTQYVEATESKDELASLEGRFTVVDDDLAYLEANDETTSLQARLNTERAKPQPQALPSPAAVGEFSSALLRFGAEQGLSFPTFDKIDTSVSIGDTAYPSLRHSVETQGTGEAQTGLLQLISDFPTAKVLDLVFTRAGNPSEWHMRLEMDVFYR